MAQKGRTSRVSKGGRQKANVNQEKKRQEKFAAKREAGKAYEYKKNPYKPGSKEFLTEQAIRADKTRSSKLPLARLTSIFAKLENTQKKELELKKKKLKAS